MSLSFLSPFFFLLFVLFVFDSFCALFAFFCIEDALFLFVFQLFFMLCFHFENELMQDHFNDKDYMNSDEFPKSEFKGILNNINKLDLTKDETNKISTTGSLTIHGITQKVFAAGTITVSKGKISLKSIFKIKRADYGITTNEIADELEITVTCRYD